MNVYSGFFYSYSRPLLFSLIVFSATPCWALSEGQTEKDYILDFPVVLSAARLSQPLYEAPNAVTLIDRSMIKASGFRTIADLFKLVPGMYVDYQSGAEPIVGYRGATDSLSRRMQVLIDGRSVYLPPFNVVDWADLPLHIDDIERIEVVRGPAATSYGSNSILGVINIISRDASAQRGLSVSVTKGNAGNADISDAVAHFGGGGEKFDYRLTVGVRSDNGLAFPANYSHAFDGYNNDNAAHFATLRGNYQHTLNDSFDFQLGYSQSVRVTGNPNPESNMGQALFPPRNVESSSGYQQINWLHTLNNYDDIQLHYYHISRTTRDQRFTYPIIGVSYWVSDLSTTHRHELELQHTLQTSPNNRVVWGMATRLETVDAGFLFSTPQSAHQYRLFAHDEWRIQPKLVLNAGSMLEDDGLGNKNTSPRASLNYSITHEHTLRAGVSVAYRNPAFVEVDGNSKHVLGTLLFQQFMSTGGLRPERALSREIGYIGKLREGLTLDLRGYNDQVSDVIWVDARMINVPGLTTASGTAWDFRNDFAVHYTGMEATLKLNWEANSLTCNFAHQMVSAELLGTPRISAYLPAFQNYTRNYSNTAPLNSSSVLLSRQTNSGWLLGLGYYQQGRVMVLDAIQPQPLTRRLDFRIARQLGLNGAGNSKPGKGEIAVVVQNALQENIVGYSGYQFVRRAFVTVGYQF
jgi:iron complex outermembrane receptor protein